MNWNTDQAKELYGIDRWGNEYFDVSSDGEVVVNLRDGEKTVPVSLQHIVEGLTERGSSLPQLLRFRDLLDRRIEHLNEAFNAAINNTSYKGHYRGVYPIKVNQQQQVIEEITDFGKKYHFGLEAGSKPELIAALAYMHDPEAMIVCNGYKDSEFIDLALHAKRMGLKVMLVLEMPGELDLILERSEKLGIRPDLGVRFRLSTKSGGHWAESGGDRSVFGLNTAQVLDVVDRLKTRGYIDCLQMLHYHQGSQLPNIRSIREAATEAVRVYTDLVKEGAPMGVLDMGGGLAVDYGGAHTNFSSSCNYSIQEYCTDLIEVIQKHCDDAGISHPNIITESGRAIVTYYSVLVFNVLDVSCFESQNCPDAPYEGDHEMLHNIYAIKENLQEQKLQEAFNDAQFYRDQIRALFIHGVVGIRERAFGEKMYWYLCTQIAHATRELERVPEELQALEDALTDIYYGNFSVFQSLPDSWAIDQLFPVLPIHRLNEEPKRRAIFADITCDCDGKIDRKK